MKKIIRGILFSLLLLGFCGYEGYQSRVQIKEAQIQKKHEEEKKEQEKKEQQEEQKQVIDPDKPMLAITFDDGPGKYTNRLLKILEKYDAKATFFLVGNNISKYPDAVKKMDALGCEYGNHTMAHADLTKLKKKDIKKQIDRTDAELKKIVGKKTTLIRPPYGAVNQTLRETAQKPLILWSMDTLDWKKKDAKKVRNYIMKYVEDGEIILVHDIHKTTVDAMEKVIPELIKKGYQLVTVSELAGARGTDLQAGTKYFSFYPADNDR